MLRTRAAQELEAECQQPTRAASTPPELMHTGMTVARRGEQEQQGHLRQRQQLHHREEVRQQQELHSEEELQQQQHLHQREGLHQQLGLQSQHQLLLQQANMSLHHQPPMGSVKIQEDAHHSDAAYCLDGLHASQQQPTQGFSLLQQTHNESVPQASVVMFPAMSASGQHTTWHADEPARPYAHQLRQADPNILLQHSHKHSSAALDHKASAQQPATHAGHSHSTVQHMLSVQHISSDGQSTWPVQADSAVLQPAAEQPGAAMQTPVRRPHHQHGHVITHTVNRGAGAQGHSQLDHDDTLQVQKLCVTPHKPPRQLSGNPFADPPLTGTCPPEQHQHGFTQHLSHSAASQQKLTATSWLAPHAARKAQHDLQADVTTGAHHVSQHMTRPAEHDKHVTQLSQQAGHMKHSSQQDSCKNELTHQMEQIHTDAVLAAGTEQNRAAPAQLPFADRHVSLPATSSQAAASVQSASTHRQAEAVAVESGQPGRALLDALEREAVAADEEACLQELQVCRPCIMHLHTVHTSSTSQHHAYVSSCYHV